MGQGQAETWRQSGSGKEGERDPFGPGGKLPQPLPRAIRRRSGLMLLRCGGAHVNPVYKIGAAAYHSDGKKKAKYCFFQMFIFVN